jgi:ribose transport system ATP-binding protein
LRSVSAESAATARASGRVVLRARGVQKSFPGVRALRAVDFDVRPGEVHGLVGENAAGKSTLIKILTGAHTPDAGEIEAFGRRVRSGDPRARRLSGIGAIYQEAAVVPEMSAAANVFLGRPRRRGWLVSRRATHRAFRELGARVGLTIDPDVRAGSLSIAHQRMLEIMRGLVADHRILIMDEPTASLGPAERALLYETIAGLRRAGVAIVYVSHDLDEVLALCDRVSVMRDGDLVVTDAVQRWTKESLVRAMLGRACVPPPRERVVAGEEVLRVAGLTVPGALEDISFSLRRGEILGVAGLVGSGRTQLLRALAGADGGMAGRLVISGREHRWPRSVREALALGIALVPEERVAQALVTSLSGAANVWLTNMRSVADGPVLREHRRLQAAETVMRPLAFDVTRLREPAGFLSGGSQQKLVVGKWLHRLPAVLLLDEFTRGIDVGAKAELLVLVRRIAAQGTSMIIVSSELEELAETADRVVVLARGRLVGELGWADASVERILRLVFAVEEPPGP